LDAVQLHSAARLGLIQAQNAMMMARTTADKKLTRACHSVSDVAEFLQAAEGSFRSSSDRGSVAPRAGSEICVTREGPMACFFAPFTAMGGAVSLYGKLRRLVR